VTDATGAGEAPLPHLAVGRAFWLHRLICATPAPTSPTPWPSLARSRQ
jgi:hypothetical protein